MAENVIQAKGKKALQDKIDPERLEWIEGILRENLVLSLNRSKNSLLVFTAISMLWLLIKFSYVEKISYSGVVEINNTELILLILPLIASLYFYRFASIIFSITALNYILKLVYNKLIPSFQSEDLESFFMPSEFITNELNLFSLFKDKKDFLALIYGLWGVILFIIVFCIPITFLCWLSYQLICFPVFKDYLSQITGLLVIILVIMSLIQFICTWNET
jgi:hypothetical protein